MVAQYFQYYIPFLNTDLKPSNTSKFGTSGLTIVMASLAVHVSFFVYYLPIEGN